VVELLDSSRSKTRVNAALLLGEIANEDAIDPLVSRLDDPDASVQFVASRVLSKFEEPAFEKLWHKLLTGNHQDTMDKDDSVKLIISQMHKVSNEKLDGEQFQLVTLLSILGRLTSETIPSIIEYLATTNNHLRYLITLSLIGMESAAFVHLFSALQHPNELVCAEASRILEYHGVQSNNQKQL